MTRIRLASGLVLFAYVGTHLINHSWGLSSMEALNIGRDIFTAVWRSWPGTILLYGALLAHFALILGSLYKRRSLRMRVWEAAQILLGLAIPFLLAEHVLGTRGLNATIGVIDDYIYEILVLWVYAPDKGIVQTVLLVTAWLHGCAGIHFWLRLKPWYRGCSPYLFAFAIILPVTAVFGFVAAGREIKVLAGDPIWLEDMTLHINWPDEAAVIWVGRWKAVIWEVCGGLLALVIVARGLRWAVERRRGVVRLTYPGGRVAQITPGISVLEASREAGIEHASVCGGRGRCSTCRIRLGEGREHVEPAGADEQKILKRVGVPENVRLACQLRPTKDLEVIPLLPPNATPKDAYRKPAHLQGSEREVAILFADIRKFTQFSENKLPYDVVFVLNRYFRAMGEVVDETGGELDKFIGDGVMALFGANTTPEEGCRRVLEAARRMSIALDELNQALRADLDEPLRIGIGIHLGTVIVGEMGFSNAVSFTAIGDAVNTASRLEQATKEYSCQLIVSQDICKRAGVALVKFPLHEIQIRGRGQPVRVHCVEKASDMSEIELQLGRRARRERVPAAP
ncbi:MAG: adenylate/guanylate cyclase domain-containing protein [Alphaproteobacteria bacterium]|nr:adenylate/guanylate cyclase domain-containing protein [Alphaproteobacteria bacterium]